MSLTRRICPPHLSNCAVRLGQECWPSTSWAWGSLPMSDFQYRCRVAVGKAVS